MAIQFVTDQLKNNAVTAAKAKLDELWAFSVAPQSSIDGASANDLVRYSQISGLLNGVHWKDSCRAATTGNITLSGTQTIDGVSCGAGDRVLVRAQTAASGNGIYEVAAAAWARSSDMDAGGEFPGAAVLVREGTTNADTGFICTNDTDPNVGVDAINFTSFFNSVIADGSITDVKIASNAAIAFSKLAALTSGNLLVGSAGNAVASVAMSGDATIANNGALTIGNGAITGVKIGDTEVSLQKLEAVSSAQIILGNASNRPAKVAVTGDVTLSNSGVTTIGNDKVGLPQVAWLPRFQSQVGNGSAAAYDLAAVVETTHYDGVLAFRNGQMLKKVAVPADLSEYKIDFNSGTSKTRITLGANLPTSEEIVIWYIA